MDLREVEKGRMACDEKLFEQMFADNVKYGKGEQLRQNDGESEISRLKILTNPNLS